MGSTIAPSHVACCCPACLPGQRYQTINIPAGMLTTVITDHADIMAETLTRYNTVNLLPEICRPINQVCHAKWAYRERNGAC